MLFFFIGIESILLPLEDEEEDETIVLFNYLCLINFYIILAAYRL
jgi:hypothetical protein